MTALSTPAEAARHGAQATRRALLWEWQAHRPLWLGIVVFATVAVLVYPLTADGAYTDGLSIAAGTALAILAALALALYALTVSSAKQTAQTLDGDLSRAYLSGARKGLIALPLAALGTLILSLLLLLS